MISKWVAPVKVRAGGDDLPSIFFGPMMTEHQCIRSLSKPIKHTFLKCKCYKDNRYYLFDILH